MEGKGKVACKNTRALAHGIITFQETMLVVGDGAEEEARRGH